MLLTTTPAIPVETSSWVYLHNTLGQVSSSLLLSFIYLSSEPHSSHLDYRHYHLHLFPCTHSVPSILLRVMRLHWYDGRSRLTKSFPSSKFHSHTTPDPPPRVCQEMSSAWPSTPLKVSFPEFPFRNPFKNQTNRNPFKNQTNRNPFENQTKPCTPSSCPSLFPYLCSSSFFHISSWITLPSLEALSTNANSLMRHSLIFFARSYFPSFLLWTPVTLLHHSSLLKARTSVDFNNAHSALPNTSLMNQWTV